MNDDATGKKLEIPECGEERAVIRISGFFNQKEMAEFERALSKVDRKSPRLLILDFSNLEHIDTPNLALLVGKHNEYRAQGRRMVLRNVPPGVKKIIELSRLDRVFEIEERTEREKEPISERGGETIHSLLFRFSTDPIFLFDPRDGAIVDANPLARELVGDAEFLDRSVSIYDLCEELRSGEKPWEDWAPSGQSGPRTLEQTWRFSENLRRQMKVSYIPADEAGKGSVLAICQDVTPERELETENRNLRKQLRTALRDLSFLEKRTRDFNRLLERGPLCLSILDGALEIVREAGAGMVLLFNSLLNKLTVHAAIGFPRSDRLTGLCLEQGEVLPGIPCDSFWRHLKKESKELLSTKMRIRWEEAIKPRRIGSSWVYPLISQQAQVGFLILVSFDEQRNLRSADEELLESLTLAGSTALEKSFLVERIRCSEIHLRSILESIPISVFSVDPGGHVDTWNRESEKLFEWKAEDAIGLRLERFYPDGDSLEWKQLRQALSELAPWTGEIEIRTKSGERVPTRHMVHPFPSTEGARQGMVFVVEDIRPMVDLRNQMMKAQKLESVGILAGGIAHDFNNLIGAILGYASFLRTQLGEENKNTRYVEVIESTAEQASGLTRKLLEFARGASDQKYLTDLRGLMEDCLALVKPSIPVGVELAVALPSEPLYAFVSPPAIQQIVMNLCLNARDAVGEEGRIAVRVLQSDTVSEKLITPPPAQTDCHWAVIEVEDNGAGIEEELVSDIVKPFFTTKPAGKGSGLGLAIVYRTVIDHGGWMELTTRVGKGTRFRIGLPLNEITAADPVPESAAEESKGELILVVDDEPLVRELALTVLQSSGYEVRSAADGAEALELFKEDPDRFGLAIVDVLMPVMGGEELVREIGKIRPNFPILLSSGYAPKTSLDEKIKSGELEFLPKPYRSSQLLEKVEQLLGKPD